MTVINGGYERTFADDLGDGLMWELYAQRKAAKMNDERKAEEFLDDLPECKDISRRIACGDYTFSDPVRLEVDKPGSTKKRITYTFKKRDSSAENTVLGRMNSLLQRYDHLFAPNLYSYRYTESINTAMHRLGKLHLSSKYAYKADISNYFNSIPVGRLLARLRTDIDDRAVDIIEGILNNRHVIYHGSVIADDEKGVMAGIPISSFLANYYLKDMDWSFHNDGVLYCRFADDIIVFADTKEELDGYIERIRSFVGRMGLTINEDKEFIYMPGETVTFLGLDLHDDVIDLSRKAMDRTKKKIKKTADCYRMKVRKGEMDRDYAMIYAISSLDRRFFGSEDFDVSWSSWYFPLLTTDRSLKILDAYAQQCIRYVATGKVSGKNFRTIPYSLLSDYGYLPLVSRYYGGAYGA